MADGRWPTPNGPMTDSRAEDRGCPSVNRESAIRGWSSASGGEDEDQAEEEEEAPAFLLPAAAVWSGGETGRGESALSRTRLRRISSSLGRSGPASSPIGFKNISSL